MKRIIGVKDNKGIIGTVLTLFIIICLIVVCLYRLITGDFDIIVKAVLIGLIGFGCFFFGKELIVLIKIINTPTELIVQENDQLLIYSNKQQITINTSDIIEIQEDANNSKLLFYQANLTIKTKENTYLVQNIKDIQEVSNQLKSLIKVGE